MKVSRKVGRRNHSRGSSISRRRFRSKKSRSGYKKKYAKTQRGGARSRKYGNKRTHKRGKRFHRGGGNGFERALNDPGSAAGRSLGQARQRANSIRVITDANELKIGFQGGRYKKEDYKNEVDVLLAPCNTNCVVVFKVKKITGGIFPTQSQRFFCTLTFRFNKTNPSVPVMYSFALEREDRKIVFSLSGESKMKDSILPESATNQQILVEKLKSADFLKQMKYFPDNTNPTNIILYDFSDPTNIPIFDALANIILDSNYTQKAKGVDGVNISASANTPALAPSNEELMRQKEQKQEQYMLEQEEYKKKLSEEKEKINEEVKRLGDELEVTLLEQTTPVKFNDFKTELMQIAESSIGKIMNSTTLDDDKKEGRKGYIKFLLLELLLSQYKIMKRIYLLTKIKELNDTDGSPLYKQVTGYDNIDTNPFLGRMISDLLQNTENVKKIMEGLGDETYDVPSKYLIDKNSVNKLSESLNSLDDESEQKTKLEKEIEELFTKVQ